MTKKQPKNYARRTAKYFNFWRKFFQNIVSKFWYGIQFKLMYRIEVEGKENIPKDNKFIVCGNHLSSLDPFLVCFVMPKPVAFMAKKELFEKNDKRHNLIHWLGAFSVDREKPEISTFKTVKDIFQTNWSLGIFPEGGTKKNKKIEDIRKGFVVIAKHAKADIVPVSIIGFDGYSKKLFEKNVKVVIGKPISYKLDTDEIIQQWCAEICKNTGFENCMINKEEQVEV